MTRDSELAPPAAAATERGPRGLVAVVASAEDGTIGAAGGLPWRLRRDLQRFKRMTMGGVLIMGRKTFETIGRPLPGRRTVVITRRPDWQAAGVEVVDGPVAAAARCEGGAAGYVVGGAEVFDRMLELCGEIWLTRVWSDIPGDTSIRLDLSDFVLLESMRLPAGEHDEAPTEFRRLVRRKLFHDSGVAPT